MNSASEAGALWSGVRINILRVVGMIELNTRRWRGLSVAMHLTGCVISMLVLLTLPTLRFHHCRVAFGTQEIEREAARQTFVAPTDSTPLTQIARPVQQSILAAAPAQPSNQQRVNGASATIVLPLARVLMRLKLPPGSSDPYQAVLA
jgi:hypothetical protein